MSLEASSLLRDGDNSLPGTKAVSGRHMAPRRRVFVASVSLAVSVILLCGAITWKTKAKTFDENNPLAFAGESLAWVAHNKYTKEHGFVGLDYPWLNLGSLAEPHVKTTLRVFNSNKDVKCSYKWQFLGQTGEGISLDVVFTSLGNHPVTVTEFCSGSQEPTASFTQAAVVRYVRRELRQLDDDDRSLFFNSAKVLWDTSAEDGRSTYGSNFITAKEFTIMHSAMAASRDCDHMHDGTGFLTQHATLSALFEKSIQSIAPSASLPYWDFTIDGEKTNDDHDGDYSYFFSESPVFKENWFGTASLKSNTVEKGLWAYTKVATDAWDYTHNSYGLLRAPWNNLNTEYVTRHFGSCGISPSEGDTFPTCSTHYSSIKNDPFFASTSSASQSWVINAQSLPHGPVHLFLGGEINCEDSYDKLVKECGFDIELVRKWRVGSYGALKTLWRYGLVEFPGYCSRDTPSAECTYYCPELDDVISGVSTSNTTLEDYVGVLNPYAWTFEWMSKDERICLAKTLCSAHVVTGDHIEASSAYDISFWPVHPTLERLFQYKVLSGNFQDMHWSEKSITAAINAQLECYGHRPNEKVLFLPESASTSFVKFDSVPDVSNAEVYDALNPKKDSLTYIYADFEWKHCTEKGYDFRALNVNAASSAVSGASSSERGVDLEVSPNRFSQWLLKGSKQT